MFQMTAIRSALLEIQKAQAWCGNRVELSWTTSKRPRTPYKQLLNVPERPESVYRAEASNTSVARVGRNESLK